MQAYDQLALALALHELLGDAAIHQSTVAAPRARRFRDCCKRRA